MKTLNNSILLISLIILAGCKSGEDHTSAARDLPVANVRAVTVTAMESNMQTEVVGTVRSVNRAVIAAKVTGTIEEMPVVLGSTVKAGDLLVRIGAGEISAKAIQAQAQLEQARRNLERERKLLQKNAATSENVKSLEDVYRVAEAMNREAEAMLGYTAITAPFDGVITAKPGNVGDLATPGAALLHLEDNNRLQVETSAPETLVLHIKPGDTLAIHIPAANLDLAGTVAQVAPAADPMSRTALVKIDIKPEPQLRSGQFARVVIPGKRKKSLFVPSEAIHVFGQMEKLFVVKNNAAQLRLVRTGTVAGGQTEILAGLESGETVAVEDSSRLIDGQPVKIVQ